MTRKFAPAILLLPLLIAFNLRAQTAKENADLSPAPTPTISIDPAKAQRAKEFMHLGNQYSDKGVVKKAQEYWDIAKSLDPDIAIEPNGNSTHAESGALSTDSGLNEKTTGKGQQDPIGEILKKAESARESNEAHSAFQYLEEADEISPKDPRVAAFRDQMMLETFQVDQEKPYNKLTKNYFDKAVVDFRNKHYAQALEAIEQAQKMDPDNPQIEKLMEMLENYNSENLLNREVERAKNKWDEGNTDNAEEILGNILLKHPGFQKAIDLKAQIDKSIEKEKADAMRPVLDKAKSDEKENRYMAEKSDYEKALKIDPQNKEASAGLERVSAMIDPLQARVKEMERAYQLKQKKTAEACLRDISKWDPNYPNLTDWKTKIAAMVGMDSDKDTEAKADEAYNLGLESYRKDDFVNAKKFWQETLEIDPRNLQAKRNLDRLLEVHPDLK